VRLWSQFHICHFLLFPVFGAKNCWSQNWRNFQTDMMAKRSSMLICAALLLLCVAGAGADSDIESKPAQPAGVAAVPQEATVPAEPENKAHTTETAADAAPAGPADAADTSGAGVDLDQVLMAAGAVATLCAMAGGWFLMNQGGPKKRRFKGDAVFLVGPCDSGKTAVMFQLRDGDTGDKLRPTHSSMTFNEDTFAVAGVGGKPVRIIDFPGHSRLRPQLFDMIEDCASLVFVIDSCAFSAKGLDTRICFA